MKTIAFIITAILLSVCAYSQEYFALGNLYEEDIKRDNVTESGVTDQGTPWIAYELTVEGHKMNLIKYYTGGICKVTMIYGDTNKQTEEFYKDMISQQGFFKVSDTKSTWVHADTGLYVCMKFLDTGERGVMMSMRPLANEFY